MGQGYDAHLCPGEIKLQHLSLGILDDDNAVAPGHRHQTAIIRTCSMQCPLRCLCKCQNNEPTKLKDARRTGQLIDSTRIMAVADWIPVKHLRGSAILMSDR